MSFPGFFNMWGFGRANKQANQSAKKTQESLTLYSLELIGDLIGHSSAVQVCWLWVEQQHRDFLLLLYENVSS